MSDNNKTTSSSSLSVTDKNIHSLQENEKDAIAGGFLAGLSRSLARAVGQLGRSGVVKGGISGMFEEGASYPLDLVKSKMQTSTGSTSILSIFSDIYKSEGAIGLFKGLSSPLLASAIITSTQFGVFEGVYDVLNQKNYRGMNNTTNLLFAGATSGFIQSFITTPVDVVKIKMQLQGDAHGGGNLKVARSIFNDSGLKGIYRGLGATLYRDVPGLAIFFTSYESFKSIFGVTGGHGGDNSSSSGESKDSTGFLKILLSGGLAGCLYHSSTHPFDVVKTLLQADIKKEKYNGTFDCMKKVYSKYGYKGLFKGYQPTVLKSFLSNAVGFWVYELIQDYFKIN